MQETIIEDQPTTREPGDLWLKTPVSQVPVKALPANMLKYKDIFSRDKLVVGGAGSGRSLMTGRLCQAAHEKGNIVVMVATRYRNQAMYQLANKAGGAIREIGSYNQVSLNPFLFPERIMAAYEGSSLIGVQDFLADLLLSLMRAASPTLIPVREHSIYGIVRLYYKQRPWESTGAIPSFDNFYEFIGSEAAQTWTKSWPEGISILENFLAWVTEAGRPFYATGEFAYLLKGQPEQVAELFTQQNSLLYIELAAIRAGNELHDKVAAQCVWWLLVFGIDTHFSLIGGQQQKLTIAIDEWPKECLGEREWLFGNFMRTRRKFAGEVITSWQDKPSDVFSDDYPTAQSIRYNADCHILLNSGPDWHNGGELLSNDEEKKLYTELTGRQVLVLRAGEFSGVYDATMSQEELSFFEETPA